MIDIDKAFNPETKSVHAYYQSPGVGFYIPLYQREYSWDNDNIDQLLDDVAGGVDSLIENPKDEIRFLGTIIAVKVVDKRKIYPIDPQGLPSLIENIIDGQQRLSTIALFSILLYKHIHLIENKLKASSEDEMLIVEQLKEICNYWKAKLIDVFSLDLKRGTPHRKPKIIRGNKDQWTKDGDIEKNYVSEVANHIAAFIGFVYAYEDADEQARKTLKIPKLNTNNRAGKNLNRIDRWLRNTIISAHNTEASDFLPAWDIIQKIDQENIWQYDRQDLKELVLKKEKDNKRSLGYNICSLVQLFSVIHYLLDRCCFTIIQPMNEDWAFDMFQSLNATGTPLTAIETFKPTVVNVTDAQSNKQYKGSESEISFEKVDCLFTGTKSASQKSKLANEFLTSFALVANGYKLESHFSKQRRWLEDTYAKFKTFQAKNDFIHFFGNYAKFYKDVWIDYKGENNVPITAISSHKEAEITSLIILYLKESNHKMAITILGSFYKDVIDGKENSITNFVEVTKLIGAFYTLWRSADSNAKLDNVYRAFFRGEDDSIKANNWEKKRHINLDELRPFLQKKLDEKGIGNKESWLRKAKNYLSHNKSKSVSKFTLFVTAHDTIPDSDNLGLMKKGTPRTANYLTLRRWNSKDLKTIEHVAPQKPSSQDLRLWDTALYGDDERFQSIGNLTLLPAKVNISASNKGWVEKHLYYQHLCQRDQQKLQELANKARSKGLNLSPDTISMLQDSNFNDHIEPIVNLGEDGVWDAEFVEKRSIRMLEILWDITHKWY